MGKTWAEIKAEHKARITKIKTDKQATRQRHEAMLDRQVEAAAAKIEAWGERTKTRLEKFSQK